MRVVLLTHVFPRAAEDPLGAFLLHLVRAYGDSAAVLVVAPHAPALALDETVANVPVRRFRYASDAAETLAYTGVMHEQVARGVGGKVQFARFAAAYYRAAVAAVREWRADVIHAHWWLPGGLVGALASKRTGAPLVITTHGTDIEQLRRASWVKSAARWTLARARWTTCGSTYLRERLVELNVVDPARVRVIPMPVNPLFIQFAKARRVEARRADADDSAPFNLLCVSRLTRQKAIDTLIAALARLRARGIGARLTIIGDGDQRRALQEQVDALHLSPFVEFLGMRPQSELPEWYAQCDAFVLPSVREGMGLVLAEALLCGAPVVACASGGVTDIVRDGETGLLFAERDAAALATQLERLARDRDLARRLAATGHASVRARYQPQRVAEEFMQLFADARAVGRGK